MKKELIIVIIIVIAIIILDTITHNYTKINFAKINEQLEQIKEISEDIYIMEKEQDIAENTCKEGKENDNKTSKQEKLKEKIKIMEEIVRAKFVQNPELAQKLIATGNAYLEEGNTWGDKVWGTVNGSGANNLGIILMKVRNELAEY